MSASLDSLFLSRWPSSTTSSSHWICRKGDIEGFVIVALVTQHSSHTLRSALLSRMMSS